MPATPAIFSNSPNALDTLLSGTRRPFFEELGSRLVGLIDRFAPEGYEDEVGFHPLSVRSSDNRAPLAELNCLGEHI